MKNDYIKNWTAVINNHAGMPAPILDSSNRVVQRYRIALVSRFWQFVELSGV
jgi:hypothetical protein